MTGPTVGTDERRPLPAGAAVLALARAALIRTVRGRALWVVTALAALPPLLAVVLAHASRENDQAVWRYAYEACLLMLAVVPPVLVASAIADELEDKTAAYLWSRALPRWAVVIGKLAALAPLCAILLGGSAAVAYLAGGLAPAVRTTQMIDGAIGLAAAGCCAATIAAAIAVLIPRHAVAMAVAWMALDATVGLIPIPLRQASTAFAGRTIAGFTSGGATSSAIALIVLTAISTTLACWRIARLE